MDGKNLFEDLFEENGPSSGECSILHLFCTTVKVRVLKKVLHGNSKSSLYKSVKLGSEGFFLGGGGGV